MRRVFGGFTGVFGALWVAGLVASLRSGELAAALAITVVFVVILVSVLLLFLLRAVGNTHVGPAGLRLRGAFAREFIAWDQVVDIKDRFHPGRGTGWWAVEAQLANGRVRRLPGFYYEGPPPGPFSGPKRDREFDDQLFEVRKRLHHWQNA